MKGKGFFGLPFLRNPAKVFQLGERVTIKKFQKMGRKKTMQW